MDAVLARPRLRELAQRVERRVLVEVTRSVLAKRREHTSNGHEQLSPEEAGEQVAELLSGFTQPGPTRVINATGTILHTNLGRAPLSEDARRSMWHAAGYADLELDRSSGRRGTRQSHVDPLLNALLGSEAALFVVNNAAALLLALTVIARRREVVLSRGDAVEIGDGFRITEIAQQSGARLIEVGATNRTSVSDYDDAINDRTAAILRVHSSNFAMIGFTEAPPTRDLARLASRRKLPLVVDNGSGAIVDTTRFGMEHEPMPAESIAAGADLVTFSTDKLLGGPQGGVVAGRRELVAKLSRHPFARALRPDKTSVAALHATLLHYVNRETHSLPVIAMLSRSLSELTERANRIVSALADMDSQAGVVEGSSLIGGGSLPRQELPTAQVVIRPRAASATKLGHALRQLSVPVIVRVQGGRLILDMRTVQPSEDAELLQALRQALSEIGDA